MIKAISNAWKIPELRKKIIFTLLILLVYRVGCYIPVPGVDVAFIRETVGNTRLIMALKG
jgi:preprotein translocase subunit SecY